MTRSNIERNARALKINLIEQAILQGLASFRHNELTKDGDLALCIRTALQGEERLVLKLKPIKTYRSATKDEREWEECIEDVCDNKVAAFARGDFYCAKHVPLN